MGLAEGSSLKQASAPQGPLKGEPWRHPGTTEQIPSPLLLKSDIWHILASSVVVVVETPHLFKGGKCTGLLLSFVTIPGGGGGGNPTPI
jgi:hypothetical protein